MIDLLVAWLIDFDRIVIKFIKKYYYLFTGVCVELFVVVDCEEETMTATNGSAASNACRLGQQHGGMYVVKRDGRQEPVAFDKITARIQKLANGLNEEFCDPVRNCMCSYGIDY